MEVIDGSSSETIVGLFYKYKATDSWDKSESDYKDHDLKPMTWNKIRKSVEGLVPSYTCIFLDFIRTFSSYVKGLPKKKQCNSVQFRCICETALRVTRFSNKRIQ